MYIFFFNKLSLYKYNTVDKLKSSKIDQNGCIFSDSIILVHGTDMVFDYVCILFNTMICHGYAPPSFIKSSIVPIPKGTKTTLTDSDKYRTISSNSILRGYSSQNIPNFRKCVYFQILPEYTCIYCLLSLCKRSNRKLSSKGVNTL